MRGVNRTRITDTRDERGVIAPLTAILMTAMLGMAALVVDAGMMYSEHAQLQNGADASALAIAMACAADPASVGCQNEKDAAPALAGGNALDGATAVIQAKVEGGTVNVEVQALATTGEKYFSPVFARALGIATVDIRAAATAKWQYPSSGSGFPLAISQKCWNFAPAGKDLTLQKITWKPGTSCTNAAGTQVPGGWGWLANPADKPCEATTKVGDYATSNPGNDPPKMCEKVLKDWINTLTAGGKVEVTFPVFDSASGSGNTGTFHITGYATFRIFGWKFASLEPYSFRTDANDPYMTKKLACSAGNERCIIGAFVRLQTSRGGGGGLNFGTSSVSLIK